MPIIRYNFRKKLMNRFGESSSVDFGSKNDPVRNIGYNKNFLNQNSHIQLLFNACHMVWYVICHFEHDKNLP